jgi:hypothetical protein
MLSEDEYACETFVQRNMMMSKSAEKLDTLDKLLKSMKTLPIQIGEVILHSRDFKWCYIKPWDIRASSKKKTILYRQLRAKFYIIAKLVRRYIQYHRQSQYLICFINSRNSFTRSRLLTSNKSGIISVMQSYLESFSKTQEVLDTLEKVLIFLEDSCMSIKKAKVEEIIAELYLIEDRLKHFCIQMNDLLRNSDGMIASGSYDDGQDDPSIKLNTFSTEEIINDRRKK